jgi:Tannase-like family of unknown function (DUF6351)
LKSPVPTMDQVVATTPQSRSAASHSALLPEVTRIIIDRNYLPRESPGMVAGGALADNVLKCRPKPIVDPFDYTGATFTPAELGPLMAIFPTGVCDWTTPGVGYQRPEGIGESFGPCLDDERKTDERARNVEMCAFFAGGQRDDERM